MSAHGEAAAGLVLTVLAGIPPSNIPVVEPEASVTQFDWRQLQRWGVRESQLPQGSAALFRQLSFWDKYKLYVVGVAAILTLQAVIIGGLLLQRNDGGEQKADYAQVKNGCDWLSRLLASAVLNGMSRQA
jgi:hypothetical protein